MTESATPATTPAPRPEKPRVPERAEFRFWTEEKLRARLTEYHVGHRAILLDPDARNIRHTYILPAEDKQTWRVQQVLVDPEGHNDWIAEFVVDLPASRTVGEPVWGLGRIAPLS